LHSGCDRLLLGVIRGDDTRILYLAIRVVPRYLIDFRCDDIRSSYCFYAI